MEPGTFTGTRAYVCRPNPNDGVRNWSNVSTLSDYDCPKCSRKLRAESAEGVEGVDLLVCTKCWGLAVQAKTMQGIVPDEVRQKIENVGVKHPEGHSCPVCPSTMLEIAVPKPFGSARSARRASEHDVKIDICGDCATIWFDVGELDALNGIKPKLREVKMGGSAVKKEAHVDPGRPLVQMRMGIGAILLFIGIGWAGSGGFGSLVLGLLLAIGGGILAVTTAPETGLEKGACSRCGIPNQTIGWTCQRAGCEAPICTTCRSVGDDPAETYVKTLGGGALMVAGGVLGLGLLIATEGLVGDLALAPAAVGYELLSNDDEEKNLLLCKECKKEMGALQFATTETKKVPEKEKTTVAGAPLDVVDTFTEGVKDAESKSANSEEYLKSQTHCLHVDGEAVKRCRRMVYRKSGYCYQHQRE